MDHVFLKASIIISGKYLFICICIFILSRSLSYFFPLWCYPYSCQFIFMVCLMYVYKSNVNIKSTLLYNKGIVKYGSFYSPVWKQSCLKGRNLAVVQIANEPSLFIEPSKHICVTCPTFWSSSSDPQPLSIWLYILTYAERHLNDGE